MDRYRQYAGEGTDTIQVVIGPENVCRNGGRKVGPVFVTVCTTIRRQRRCD
jgi:hypothetical protein